MWFNDEDFRSFILVLILIGVIIGLVIGFGFPYLWLGFKYLIHWLAVII